jgi:hypothetical protein
VAWHACALRPVLSPLQRDTYRGGYNGVPLSAPTFLILYLGEYNGVLPHLMNHTALGAATRETWCGPPSTSDKSEPRRLSLPRRPRRRQLGRGRAIWGGLESPRPSLSCRRVQFLLRLLGCPAWWAGPSPSGRVFLLLQLMALFWAYQAHSISSAH